MTAPNPGADSYDYIVVGTGSAGSVLANRLTENADARVLALEAGGEDIPDNVHNPSLWYTLLGSEIDWNYTSVSQPGLDGRHTQEPRGKLIGGSSNLYIMMHIRGHRSDYDNWAYNGCPGWSYDDCIPWFQKMENQEDETNPTAGHSGPIAVTNAGRHEPNPASASFIEACRELGYPLTEDFNGPQMMGTGWHHINVKDGKRQGTAMTYLAAARHRANLTLVTGAHATRLLFEGTRCVGVEYVKDGQTLQARATSEVVVSAGAIESPKLLLQSGIGPADHLHQVGVEVLHDLPGVGENFHNHVLTGVIYEAAEDVPAPHQNLSEAALFTTSVAGLPAPDLQIAFVHVPFDIIIGQSHPNAVSILPGVVRPLSRGWIQLSGSGDPLAPPRVNPNYLGVAADRERLVQGVEIAREIFATSHMKRWASKELLPGPDHQDDLDAFVRGNAASYHHQAGSCKMGLDAMAVVDPQLRVHGIEGLRVADASVMPAVPSGNCHAGILMIAERCADWMKGAA